MRKTALFCWMVVASLGGLAACGHAIKGGSTTPPPAGSAPVNLSVIDATAGVPAGVAVLSFQLNFMDATLQPGNIHLLNSTVTVESQRLQSGAWFLSTTNVAPGTYTGITFTFASPILTVANSNVGAVGGCPGGSICKFTGSATPVQVPFIGNPFPVTVVANTPVGLQADLLLNNIIQSDLTLVLNASSVSVAQLPAATLMTQLAEIDDLVGSVSVVGATSFTVQDAVSGLSFPITFNGTTLFTGFDQIGCAANPQNFSCLKVGQVVAMDLSLLGNGTLVALTVEAEDNVNLLDVEGIVVALGPLPNQFSMVVLSQAPAVAGVITGDLVRVNLAQPATFLIDVDGITLPAGFLFGTTGDLAVGQEIQAQVTSVIPGAFGTEVINTSRLRLRMTQLTATVNKTVTATTFTMNGLPSFLTGAALTVQTTNQTVFDPSNLTVASLVSGESLSLRGLFFNPVAGPTLVVRKVRKR
jgi:hypothetical protein